MPTLTRRAFLLAMMKAGAACVVSYGIAGCALTDDEDTKSINFNHGVASGDPLSDAVILWTRVTPDTDEMVTVTYEIAEDEAFTANVLHDSATTDASADYTVKFDVQGLTAGTKYYYRFKAGGATSPVGETKTLPEGSVTSMKLALFSCAMWEHGYFHAYKDAASHTDIDLVVHNGDYIYEYDTGHYESPTGSPIRAFEPVNEIVTLADYRGRYAQYRSDEDLQELHRLFPWIVIWDDHEVANDSYMDGAENHDDTDGVTFEDRKANALQAYYEWLPIRVQNADNLAQAYRGFDFGDLVSIHTLESRLLARDESAAGKQNQLALITDETELAQAFADLTSTLSDANRKLIGDTQYDWLETRMNGSSATWQLVVQQVIMAQMKIPQSILLFQLDATDFAAIGALVAMYQQYAQAMAGADDATIKAAIFANTESPTLEEAVVQALTQAGLTAEQAAALAPSKVEKLQALEEETKMAYNLDAWDGYPYEQAKVMGLSATQLSAKAASGGHNMVVLTGDSHNSWANDLRYYDAASGDSYNVGVEFATTSVSSVGLEKELKELLVGAGLITEEQFDIDLFTGIFNYYIDDNRFAQLENRGYTLVTFTPEAATAQFKFIGDATSAAYDSAAVATKTVTVKAGDNKIDSIA